MMGPWYASVGDVCCYPQQEISVGTILDDFELSQGELFKLT